MKRSGDAKYKDFSRLTNNRRAARTYRRRMSELKKRPASRLLKRPAAKAVLKKPAKSILKKPAMAVVCLRKPAATDRHMRVPCCGRVSWRCTCFDEGKYARLGDIISDDFVQVMRNRMAEADIRTYQDTADMPQYEAQMWHDQHYEYLYPYALMWRCHSNRYRESQVDRG